MSSPVPSTRECKGWIHSIESCGTVDGPGIRYVVFFQGCPMRCQYCHNPETWKMKEGELWTAETLFARACRYHRYWKGKRGGEVTGGITVSGGEPLLQMEFVTRFFRLAKERGVHTALDTSGALFSMKDPFRGRFCSLMEVTDLVILDLKEMDSERHRILTGHGVGLFQNVLIAVGDGTPGRAVHNAGGRKPLAGLKGQHRQARLRAEDAVHGHGEHIGIHGGNVV